MLNSPKCNRLLSSPPPDPISPLFRRLLPRSEQCFCGMRSASTLACVTLSRNKIYSSLFCIRNERRRGEKKVLCIWWLTRLCMHDHWVMTHRNPCRWSMDCGVLGATHTLHARDPTHGPNESNKRIIIIYATEYEITQYFSFFFLLRPQCFHAPCTQHTHVILFTVSESKLWTPKKH